MDSESTATTCYRHPAVVCQVRCTRCERYVCPDCMREAPVGHRCPECVKEGARSVRQARTLVGGRISATPVVTYALFALTVLAYLAELVRPGLVDRFAMVGSRLVGPDGTPLPGGDGLFLGSGPPRVEGVAGSEWERVNRFMAGLLLWLVVSAWFTSWQGHLGGLLMGGALALAYAYAPRDGRRVVVQAGAGAGLVVLLAVTAAVKVSELTGGSVPL